MLPLSPPQTTVTLQEDNEIVSFMLGLINSVWGRREKPPVLYHHTDSISFKGIIESGCLRATHLSYTNDAGEYQHALSLLKKEVMKREPNATAEQGVLLGAIKEGLAETNLFNMFDFFITCFCTDADKLAQWRSYGKGEGGIAVGFTVKEIDSNAQRAGAFLGPVIYKAEEQIKILQQFLDWMMSCYPKHTCNHPSAERGRHAADWWQIVSFRAAHIAPLFKDEGFKEENEWRLIHLSRNIGHVQFTAKGSHLSPYVDLHIGNKRQFHPPLWPETCDRRNRPMPDKLPITELWFGPGRYMEHAHLSCKTLLEIYDYPNVSLRRSSIPFRSIV